MRMQGEREVDTLLARAETPRERRYIFNGDTRAVRPGDGARPTRKGARRRLSTFNIILSLFGVGIAIILYINSILAVNQLANEVNQLQAKYEAVLNTNAALKAEVSRKSGWERIGAMAAQQIGLSYPKDQPTQLEIDESAFGPPPPAGGQ